MKKTHIIGTIGPVSESVPQLKKLIEAGMNVARLNFSHGDWTTHEQAYNNIRQAATEMKATVPIMQDLMGPKIRIGDFTTEFVTLKNGGTFTLVTKKELGDEKHAYITYEDLYKDVKKGSKILLNDGKIELTVKEIKGTDIVCRVDEGGKIRGRRTVNVPGAYLKISSLTPKDKKDLTFGVKLGVDLVAFSFVRTADDVRELRGLLKKHGSPAKIMVKLETPEAVENIHEIIEETDSIMIARGDLAVEVPREDVPMIQKRIIELCNAAGKPVIVATQMLETMITEAHPTRAEVSDIAYAVLEGADAVMLSAETGVGAYPVESVRTMARVAMKAETHVETKKIKRARTVAGPDGVRAYDVVDSVSESAVDIARSVHAKVIVALTQSGFTARMISRFRPKQPILAVTTNDATYYQAELSYGCYTRKIKQFTNIDEVYGEVDRLVLGDKLAKKGDRVVIVAGLPFGKVGGTNMIMVHVVGDTTDRTGTKKEKTKKDK
ncbi:MAG: pyruvate kinase [Candidatus Yonathbacteria bacterium]|nr:pyruvate kinase [Candidatus Yonathbacteria bacterium]